MQERGPFYRWYVVSVLGLANTVSSIDRSFISLVAEPIRVDLGMSDTQVSLLMGVAYFLVYSIAIVPVAALADRASRRRIMSIGIFVWSSATALCGVSTGYVRLFLMRMGVGLGESMLGPSAVSVIADYFPRHLLARATAVYTVLGTVGTSLAAVIGGLLYRVLSAHGDFVLPSGTALHPWQAAFIAISVPGFVVWALMFTVREPARLQGPTKAGVQAAVVRAHLWRKRRAVLATVAGFSLVAASSGVNLWTAVLFMRTYGWSIGQIGPVLGLVTLVGTVVGVPAGGWCADALRRRGFEDANLRIILATLLVVAPAFVLLPNAGNATASIVLLGIATLGTNMCFGCATPALPLVAPPAMRSQIVALYFFGTNLLSTGVTTLVAVITDRVFADPAAVRFSMSIAYAALLPAAWVLLWIARPAFRTEVAALRDAA